MRAGKTRLANQAPLACCGDVRDDAVRVRGQRQSEQIAFGAACPGTSDWALRPVGRSRCCHTWDHLATRQQTFSPRRLTTPAHPSQRSSARAILRISVLRATCAHHTQTHVWLQETPPRPLPRTYIGRRARAFLLRLRTDFSRTVERRFRFTNSGSPSCAECPAVETTEHILLHCPGYTEQRRRLFDTYDRLGLPYVSFDHLRFFQAHRSELVQAFEALLELFGDADLIARF
ncbi:hypothetical protein MRX96_013649 [Rhipicephalus microplus]